MSENNRNHAEPDRRSASGGRRAAPPEKRSGRKKRPVGVTILIRFFQVVGTLLLLAAVTGSFLACYAAVYIKTAIIPTANLDLSAYTMNENSVIYYYDKETGEARELATLVGSENREAVSYEDIPQDLINAVVAIEDKRFFQHQGVDWIRTANGVLRLFTGGNIQGGSTITQQLIKNLTEYNDVTVTRKILEIFTALDVEKSYKKEEIITMYLNEIYLGNGCYGVQAAAQFYFGKDVSDLSLAECASLAGITNNPSLYSPNAPLEVTRYKCGECGVYSLTNDEPCDSCGAEDWGPAEIWTGRDYNKARQELILKNMADPEISPNGAYISQLEYEEAVSEELVFTWDRKDDPAGEGDKTDTTPSTVYPWYVDAVVKEVINDMMEATDMTREAVTKMVYSGGLRIYVPYDPDVQAAVDTVYNDRANLDHTSRTGQRLMSAITVVDNSTGYVVAMAGDVGGKTVNRGWNAAVDTVRQPGSSIKPLSVYSPALEMGLITPATVIDDNPRLLNGKVWPLNMPRGYRGLTTVLDGVVRSVNTIAVNVLEMVTPEKSYEFMTERYGITTLEPYLELSNGQVKSDIDYSPLAMGGLTYGVSTFEMAAAYATFPRNGAYTEPTTYLRVDNIDGQMILDNTPSTEYVIKESTAYYINNMLTSVVTSGTGYNARIGGQTVAGKTGTTDAGNDLWFVGYTSYYPAAVWTGYSTSEVINISGNPSVTLWQKVMSLVHEGQQLENQKFPAPDDLVAYNICLDCGLLATDDCANDLRGDRTKTFQLIRGDGPSEYCTCHVPVTICTASPILNANGKETGAYYLAGEFCPEEHVKEVTMVDYERVLADPSVVVSDYYALINLYESMEDPYCPLHLDAPEPDPEPEPSDDPWWNWPWWTDPGVSEPPAETGEPTLPPEETGEPEL